MIYFWEFHSEIRQFLQAPKWSWPTKNSMFFYDFLNIFPQKRFSLFLTILDNLLMIHAFFVVRDQKPNGFFTSLSSFKLQKESKISHTLESRKKWLSYLISDVIRCNYTVCCNVEYAFMFWCLVTDWINKASISCRGLIFLIYFQWLKTRSKGAKQVQVYPQIREQMSGPDLHVFTLKK